MDLSAEESPPIDVAGAPPDESAASVSSNKSSRVDTLAGAVNPYGLPLPEEQLERLVEALAPYTLHRLLGFLCAGLTVPEPLSPTDWVELIDYVDESMGDDDDDAPVPRRSIAECKDQLEVVAEHVRGQLATGEIARIVPVADDAAACREWSEGFSTAVSTTLHDLSDEEAKLSGKIRRMLANRDRAVAQYDSLPDDASKLIAIWREVPPYDPAADPGIAARVEKRWSKPVKPEVRVIHSAGTYQRAAPKVGRNDPCPCGSGKKYKKCCA